MPIMDNKLLSSKFRGCLLGSFLGDCMGAPYEGEILGPGAKVVLQKYFDKLDGPYFKAPVKKYTDDTAMTKCLAESLICQRTLNQADLARRFVKEYYTEPRRGYGQAVVEVFRKLRNTKMTDPVAPAKEQFEGTGSFGNGAAMRVSPIALFYSNDYESLIRMARKSAEVTHTHKQGVDGTILQAIAVHQSLQMDPKTPIDPLAFTAQLIEKMDKIEKDEDGMGLVEPKPYKKQLTHMSRLLSKDVEVDEVAKTLGNSVAALYSVPTAIFCFLKALSPITGVTTDNSFRRTLQYAISLGGDTDTIASMAGALSGAYHGEEIIGTSLIQHCEDAENMLKIADELFQKQQLIC